jgi:cobalt-zinc-cadmium efflux system protein
LSDTFPEPGPHPADARRLGWACVITVLVMLIEAIGGLLSGSLALLAEAGHMLTDAAALALAWGAANFARRVTDGRQPPGQHRAELVAACVNALALLAIVTWLVIEAAERLASPREIAGGTMLGIAVPGLVANLVVLRIVGGGRRGGRDVPAARLHVLGDLLGSVGACIAALVILATGWTPIDPLLSLLVALLIARSAWLLLGRSVRRLLPAAAPAGDFAGVPGGNLYQARRGSRRRLTAGRMLLYHLAVLVGWRLIRFFWRTCRIRQVGELEAARDAIRSSRSVIPVYWHQHILFGVHAVLGLRAHGLKAGFLISPSVDGTAPAMLAQKVGGHVIRGSSTHTGARALRDFYETVVRQEISPAITPDGPRGPLHDFKPGPVMIAQLTGKPILPISVAASHAWRFGTWDRFELPLPFSRVAIAYGDPVRVPRVLDAQGLARIQREMADRLEALNATARAALTGA